MSKEVLPFLKWAGGKRWLAPSLSNIDLDPNKRYIEPFLGSGAIFFHLKPEKAILSDVNPRLIETYQTIAKQPAAFATELEKFARSHDADFYYEVRGKTFRSAAKRAAHFVYLNRVCFNGIYRENLKGEFNVPLGSKTNVLLSTDNFSEISKLLKKADILHQDFEQSIEAAQSGDFLYVDPPYTTKHNKNGFIKYNQQIFSWDDQLRLAKSVSTASRRGVRVVVSNADHEEVVALYSNVLNIIRVERENVIASKAQHRGLVTEMIATNVW